MKRCNALVALGSVLSVLIATPVLATPHQHHHHRQETHLTKHHYKKAAHRAVRAHTAQSPSEFGGFVSSLVADARRYLGTNPTNRRTLWCGAFMDKVLRDTGHKGGGNLAKGYLHYGRRVSGPVVGAIAVMSRPGKDASGRPGGHVGVVSGVDANGNPIIISGDHGGTTAEAPYPRGRVLAYVMPEPAH